MGEIFRKKPLRRTMKTVYEDINKTIDDLELGVVGTVADGSITNAKLATAVKVGALSSLTTEEKASVVGAINEVDSNANTAQSTANGKYTKPAEGIPASDTTTGVQTSLGKADSAYQLPVDKIPSTDMATAVGTSLGLADSAYQKPALGIPKSDLVAAVQTTLGLADTALQDIVLNEATPVNAVAANKKLGITGTADDGETVTIGDEVYELDADASVIEGNITVDISAGTKTQATAKLTLSSDVGEGETFDIGDETYEADYDGEVTEGNILLDLSGAAGADVAVGVFTLTDSVSDGETVTIDTTIFEFDTNNTITAGNIKVNVAGNVDKQSACVALAAAIETEMNGLFDAVASLIVADWAVTVTARIKGTQMNVASTDTCANGSWASGTLLGGADATATGAADAIITTFDSETAYDIDAAADGATAVDFTADIAGALDGSIGNSIAVDATGLVSGAFGTAYLAGGTDCTEAEAGAALLAKIDSDSAIVDATDGTSNDVIVTAKVSGIAGNDIVIDEDMANGAWAGAAVKLSGGVNGTVGEKGDVVFDASYIYIAIDDNTIADDNWKKATLA